MKTIRAAHMGMCFGVRDAVALALERSAQRPLSILGDLVHNETVMARLQAAGVKVSRDEREIAPGSDVMITAHGASERTIQSLRDRGLKVLEATCPLVHAAHRAVKQLVADGFHPIIIGKRDHVEVRGLTGDLAEFDVVLQESDIAQLRARERFGIAAQTTQPIERVRRLVKLVAERFPQAQVRFVDTVCQPTKQRQQAAIDMAKRSDVVIVVGGAHSNNTMELVQTCSGHCARVHHARDASDLRLEWFDGARTIGITAGTSTPDSVIDEVEKRLEEMTGVGQFQQPA
jgi:4-hydroxy-3-methylbut-2-enyl diphosphate reductase